MPIATNRENGGKQVRAAWMRWARMQPDPKPSWLLPWDQLDDPDKEPDRVIWEEVAAPYQAFIDALMAQLSHVTDQRDVLHDRLLAYAEVFDKKERANLEELGKLDQPADEGSSPDMQLYIFHYDLDGGKSGRQEILSETLKGAFYRFGWVMEAFQLHPFNISYTVGGE